jgi:subtilisin
MSKAYVLNQLKNRGAASVIAILKPACCTPGHLARLERCFQRTEHQHEAERASRRAATGDPRYTGDTGPAMLYLENLGVVVGEVNRDGWARLQKSAALDDFGGAPPLRPVTGLGSDADLTVAPQLSWGLEKLGAPALWAKGLSGKGVLVAHLDTGVDGTHPALQDAIEHFAEFDANGNIMDGAPIEDTAAHGTHTAGTIAGRPGGPFTIGVAPGCRLVSGVVIEGGDPAKRILAGVNWAMGFAIRVLNLSAGFEGHFDQYAPLLKTIRAKGVLPVFAAGNFGPGTSCAPANYPQAMAVGAVDSNGDVDPDSSSERLNRRVDPQVPDLAMPGVDVISANAGGGFRADSGTSMAAPHAAGLAALLWEAFPKATVDQVESAIYGSCALFGSMTEARAGRGLPDGVKALATLEALMAKAPAAVTSTAKALASVG